MKKLNNRIRLKTASWRISTTTRTLWRAGALSLLCLALAACQIGPGNGSPMPSPIEPTETLTQSPPAPTPSSTLTPTESLPSDTPTPTEAEPSSTPQPTPMGTPVSDPQLGTIERIDESHGWGLFEGQVFWTGTGGQQWFDVTPEQAPGAGSLAEAFFQDASRAWVVYPDAQDPNVGTLYRTEDAGLNWQPSSTPFGFARFSFIDAQTGWAMADRGAAAGSMAVDIYSTTDGGESWELVHSINPEEPEEPGDLPFAGIKNGISFRDQTHGWITGSIPMEAFAYLYATQDGGVTWQHQEIPIPAGYETAFLMPFPPVFFGEEQGVLPVRLAAENLACVFYTTQDGGETWTPGQPVESGGAFSVPSPSEIFVWDGGTLYASQDGGATWEAITPNVDLSETIAALDFVNATTGWALSIDLNRDSTLYQTEDGGATWEALP